MLILVYLLTNKSNNTTQDTLHTIKNYIKDIQIDPNYTEEKIRIAKKIGPLLPSEYGVTFNKSILMTERIVKVMETVDFVNNAEAPKILALDLQPKDRLQKIVATIQDEVQSSKIENFGLVLDLIINMDKYKKMFTTITSLMGNKKGLSDTNSIINLMDTFMGGSSDKDKEKVNEMSKMFEILKMLDTPSKKDKPNES